MGRKKLKITRLDSMKARQVKYSKRKVGVLKKARELATLCDVDVGLVMFSPTGKPSHYVGHDKDLSTILDKLCRLSLEDRERRKAYTMRVYAKVESDGDLENHALDRGEALKLQKQQLKEVKEKLVEKRKILRDWKNPYNVESLEKIKIMEDHLNATLYKLHNLKVQLREHQNEE
ncbi:Agamous-like MADS-box protein AGL65 [Euphorbia peplus]|nr:Agamous-like MADS-box protein AGL65 [Euphorbia peplus]